MVSGCSAAFEVFRRQRPTSAVEAERRAENRKRVIVAVADDIPTVKVARAAPEQHINANEESVSWDGDGSRAQEPNSSRREWEALVR